MQLDQNKAVDGLATAPSTICRRRVGRERSGSVIIMVVSLLVLMALIGTAYLATTRLDRTSTAQNTANTQLDLFVEGVKNMTAAALGDSLFGSGAV